MNTKNPNCMQNAKTTWIQCTKIATKLANLVQHTCSYCYASLYCNKLYYRSRGRGCRCTSNFFDVHRQQRPRCHKTTFKIFLFQFFIFTCVTCTTVCCSIMCVCVCVCACVCVCVCTVLHYKYEKTATTLLRQRCDYTDLTVQDRHN